MEVPQPFEKEYLELLYDYSSDEAKKTRRNLSVASFVIISCYLVNIPLGELRIFTSDLHNADIQAVRIIAIALLLFWSILYVVYIRRDAGIQKERKYFVDKEVQKLEEQIRTYENDISEAVKRDGSVSGKTRKELETLQYYYSIYTKQKSRTQLTSTLIQILKITEYGLPLLLASVSVSFLVFDFWKNLGN